MCVSSCNLGKRRGDDATGVAEISRCSEVVNDPIPQGSITEGFVRYFAA